MLISDSQVIFDFNIARLSPLSLDILNCSLSKNIFYYKKNRLPDIKKSVKTKISNKPEYSTGHRKNQEWAEELCIVILVEVLERMFTFCINHILTPKLYCIYLLPEICPRVLLLDDSL